METGKELAVDLECLWRLGTETLPEIGKRWGGANQEMSAHAADTGVFNRSTQVVSPYGWVGNTTSVGRVYPHFDALRDALQTIFAESANNVYDAAEAIITIMNNYANEDAEAAAELNKQLGNKPHTTDTIRGQRLQVHRAE